MAIILIKVIFRWVVPGAFIFASAGIAYAFSVERIIAVVNQEIITTTDYNNFVSRVAPGKKNGDIDKELLKKVIEEKIILQEAAKLGIVASNEEVEKRVNDFMRENGLSRADLESRLKEEGITLEQYKKLVKENIISLKMTDYEVDSKVIVRDSDIKQYYENNRELFLEQETKIRIQAIYLKIDENPTVTEVTDLKIRALKIMDEIRKGEPFDKMVVLFSDEPLRSRKGFLGEFAKGELMPEIEKALSGMMEDSISEPVWTRGAVYILKLAGRVPSVIKPMDKVKDRIYQTLYEEKRQKKYNEWMKVLWGKSTISIK